MNEIEQVAHAVAFQRGPSAEPTGCPEVAVLHLRPHVATKQPGCQSYSGGCRNVVSSGNIRLSSSEIAMVSVEFFSSFMMRLGV